MTEIMVVYHSGYGHTAKQAQAVTKGMDASLATVSTGTGTARQFAMGRS